MLWQFEFEFEDEFEDDFQDLAPMDNENKIAVIIPITANVEEILWS